MKTIYRGYIYESADIKERLANQFGVEISIFEKPDGIILDKIAVPKGQRNSGIGSKVMVELCDYADQAHKTIYLNLAQKGDFDDNSISKNRLKEFYKRFGFVENSKKHKDYSHSYNMYRKPQL